MADQGFETNFSQLILGFSSAALYYLGHEDVDGEKKSEINLPLARHNIEIIELLSKKTTGNLTEEEMGLVEKILDDLRGKYKQIGEA